MELKGALHGLFRVRCFTQDDAHIFMTQEQMKDEVIKCMAMYQKMYGVFGLEYHVELSTRPENSMGSDELWEISTNALREAIETARVYRTRSMKATVLSMDRSSISMYRTLSDVHGSAAPSRWICSCRNASM